MATVLDGEVQATKHPQTPLCWHLHLLTWPQSQVSTASVHQNGFRLTNRRPGRGSYHLVWLHFPKRKTRNKTKRLVNKIRAQRATTNAATPAEPQLFPARSQTLWAAGLHLQKAEAGPGVKKCVPGPACPRARLLTTFSIIAAPDEPTLLGAHLLLILKIAFSHKYKSS